jgi:hypothetical protein
MIGASGTGQMSLILPDMQVVFTLQGTPVASAALNAMMSVEVSPSNAGSTVALQLGTPTIDIDTTDDVANESHFTNANLADAVKQGLVGQLTAVTSLLSAIPLPAMEGVQMSNLSVDADQGYVMISGNVANLQ